MSFFDPHGVSYVNPNTSYAGQVIQQRPVNYPFQALSQQNIPRLISFLQQNGYVIYKPLEVPFRDYRFVEFTSTLSFPSVHLLQDNWWNDLPLGAIISHFNDEEYSEFFKYPSDMVSEFYLAINSGSFKIDRIHPQMTLNNEYHFKIRFPFSNSEGNEIWCNMGNIAVPALSNQDLCHNFEFPSGLPRFAGFRRVPFCYVKWDNDDESWSQHEVGYGTMNPGIAPVPFNNRHIYNTLGIYEDLQQKQSGGIMPTVQLSLENVSIPDTEHDLYGVSISYQVVMMIAIAKN